MLENFQLKSMLMIMFLFFAAGTVYCQQFGDQVILIQLILRCDRNYNWLDILFYEFLLSLQSTFICCLELVQNNKLNKIINSLNSIFYTRTGIEPILPTRLRDFPWIYRWRHRRDRVVLYHWATWIYSTWAKMNCWEKWYLQTLLEKDQALS